MKWPNQREVKLLNIICKEFNDGKSVGSWLILKNSKILKGVD